MPSFPTATATAQPLPAGDLLATLATVPDPRDPRGVRYRLAGVLAVALTAVLAGARSFTAIGEWARELTPQDLARLGLPAAPEESTLRKLFARLDADTLDRRISAFVWTRTVQVGDRRVIAIDGKTIRGARGADTQAPHLVAGLDHHTGAALGQLAVAANNNEIPAVRDLLAGFEPADLHGCVITLDAMHTQTDTAEAIVSAGADYVFTVKANQPRLHRHLKALPWNEIPGHRATQTGHGRRVTRTIRLADAPTWIDFTGAAQVAQIRRTVTKRGKRSVEVVYVITSATRTTAPPAALASWVQGHWGIENRLHWVRDVTYDEDRSQVRTGSTPQIMATLRNSAISVLRLAGWTSIAAGLRHHSRNTQRALACLLTC